MIAGRFRTEFIIEALRIILEEKTFSFDGKTYRQIKSTDMGTKVAPSYVNLVMEYLEEQMYSAVGERFDQTFKEYIVQKWKRYLDDCFIFKNGLVFRVNADMNCKSANLIYCITCTSRHENYIGQMGNSICERVRVHKQQIRHPNLRQIPLSEHLDECANGTFKIFPFYKNLRADASY